METPKILGLDGEYTSSVAFSTTRPNRFVEGTVVSGTTAVHVSINGQAYTTDSSWVSLSGTTWTVPNPASYPDGLNLLAGENTVSVMAEGSSGVSAEAMLIVTLVQEGDLNLVMSSPSGLSVEQRDNSVALSVVGLDDPNVVGYNFYASSSPGGGTEGYAPISITPVSSGTAVESLIPVGDLEVDADVMVDADGNHIGTPQLLSVVLNQTDEAENILQADANELLTLDLTATKLRTTVSVSEVTEQQRYSFVHIRTNDELSSPPTVPNGVFAGLSRDLPLYYVVSAVYYDSVARLEYESSHSMEVSARPLAVTTVSGSLPAVSRQTVVQDMILSILRGYPHVGVHTGTVLRDVYIDPVASEVERLRLVLDFLHRATSFTALLEIDDPTSSGVSVPVAQSRYKNALKEALHLTSDSEAQDVIDLAFERLASNFGVTRSLGAFARGEVTFFTTSVPTSSIDIPLGALVGTGSVSFATTGSASISPSNLASTFDPTTGRYAVTVPVRATVAGSLGLVGPGQVRQIVDGVSGVSVVNQREFYSQSPTDVEGNLALATRAQRTLSSVDSGTQAGYEKVVAGVVGAQRAEVVGAGHALMQRDYDEDAEIHRGGMVDVWVQGVRETEITETFAFNFELAQNVQFEVVDVTDYKLRALDVRLTSENPLVEMLDFDAAGFGLRNATTGESYDLTGVTIVDHSTIQLDTDQAIQPALALGHVVLGDYRFRVSNKYEPMRQPIREVVSVTSTLSIEDGGTGSVPEQLISITRDDSPLQLGRSARSTAYVEIADGTGAPTGALLDVVGESHVILSEVPEYLNNLGANYLTLKVFNKDRTVQYEGPYSALPDYTIIPGNQTTSLSIKRTSTSTIASGETLSIDYYHDENFTLKYSVNMVVESVQTEVDASKHVQADVVVKEAFEVPVDITATVVMFRGQQSASVGAGIRTNLQNFFNSKRLGEPVRPSDIVDIIDSSTGVSYVILPMTKMVLSSGGTIVREPLVTSATGDSEVIPAWSNAATQTWILKDALAYGTTDGGGPEKEFQAVYRKDSKMALYSTNPSAISSSPHAAFIIGNGGMAIPGYAGETKNRVLVSLPVGEAPTDSTYSVTYVVGEDSGVKELTPGATGHLVVGTIELTFDEESR